MKLILGFTRLSFAIRLVLAILVIAGGVMYVALTSGGLRAAPAPLHLSSGAESTLPPGASLAGDWRVNSGSRAEYRVSELYLGAKSPHLAVAETKSVSGTMKVSQAAGGYVVSQASIRVGLAGLKSMDTVAGRNVSVRDGVVQDILHVKNHPDAIFSAENVAIPAAVAASPVSVTVPGTLTVNGVTRPVEATMKAQVAGNRVEVAGSIATAMTDFDVQPPQMGFTTVSPQVLVNFDIFFVQG